MFEQQGITIQKANNGYIVITPMRLPTISPQEQMLRNQVDYLKEALHGDPLLKAAGDSEPAAEREQELQIQPMNHIFVFIDFKDVIHFLRFYM